MQFAEISKNPLPLFSLFFSSGSTEALESEISQPQTCPFQAQVCLGSEDPHHELPNPSCLHPRVQGCQGEMQCLAIPGNQKGVRRCVSLTTCLQAMPGGLAATRLSMQQVIKVPFCMLNFPAGDLGDPTRNLGAFAWMYLSPAIQQSQHNNIERVLNVAKFMCGFLILLFFCLFLIFKRLSSGGRSPHYSLPLCRSGHRDCYSAEKASVSTGILFLQKPHCIFLLFIFFGGGKPSGCYTEDSRLIQSSAAKIWWLISTS